jgi:sugar/nucleoside kinase (ribokinase family)
MDLTDSIPHLRFLVAGRLSRNFTALPNGDILEDIPGGSALYASAGAAIWETGVGIVGRVGSDYPENWLQKLDKWHIDRRGVRRLSEPMDLREFIAYPDQENRIKDNPVAHFSRKGISFPKSLLGYAPPGSSVDSHTRPTPSTIRQSDFPSDYLDATAAHICPMDFLSHTLLPPTLRQGHINTITLDPGEGYMNPTFWDDMPIILNGLTAFLCNEDKLANLFQGRTSDAWEMADELSGLGCDIIVIKRGGRGQLVYERSNHARWIIPSYPARLRCLTGAGDAFCGGFLAGFRSSYDPLQAALQGNISASLVIEGIDPFFVFDCMPGLARARLDALRDMARRT